MPRCPNTDGSADRARCGSPSPNLGGAISCPHYQSRAKPRTDSASGISTLNGAQAKFWLNIESLGVEQAYVRHMTQQEPRQVQQIILAHFEELLDAWQEFERRK